MWEDEHDGGLRQAIELIPVGNCDECNDVDDKTVAQEEELQDPEHDEDP